MQYKNHKVEDVSVKLQGKFTLIIIMFYYAIMAARQNNTVEYTHTHRERERHTHKCIH